MTEQTVEKQSLLSTQNEEQQTPQLQTDQTTVSSSNKEMHSAAVEAVTFNITNLTPTEATIWKTAHLIDLTSSAYQKKQLVIKAPDVMGWDEQQTDLFHSFLKQMTLERESAALNRSKHKINECLASTQYLTKKGAKFFGYSLLATVCAWGVALGTNTFKEAQKPSDSIATRTILHGVDMIATTSSFGGAFTTVSCFALFLTNGMASSVLKRRKKSINKKQEAITIAQQENTLLQQRLCQGIREKS